MPSTTHRVRKLVRTLLRRHPRLVARVAGRLRASGLGDRITRVEAAADLAAVATPGGDLLHLLRCDGQDQVAREAAEDGWDSFEQPLPAVLAALVRARCAGGCFADVGANTGYYALLAQAVEPTATVHAYEPFPPVLEILERNCAINGGRVDVRPVALGADAGRATLYVPLADHGLIETSSSLNVDLDPSRIGSQVDVDVSTLDLQYPEGGPALLKIDVESLEPDVLEGGRALIRRRRPVIVLELLPQEDPTRLEALRAELGYVDIRLQPTAAVMGGAVLPDPDAWNHLWCPDDELDEVLTLLRGTGLRVVDDRPR